MSFTVRRLPWRSHSVTQSLREPLSDVAPLGGHARGLLLDSGAGLGVPVGEGADAAHFLSPASPSPVAKPARNSSQTSSVWPGVELPNAGVNGPVCAG
eukprot:CAMPEP_0171137618 /NCGR_PEP_ID=MMETSP0766_2-20121228/133661_1 /TAXON_ID=439317 /ORGANISM="Gambierdiscus australes, Strain CAWD 149" /LENGTH=97 /DNA_ID=CAMNT_0011601203 /DNA_START=67 /DNA_END=356 /DNA_ORIENTATION=+